MTLAELRNLGGRRQSAFCVDLGGLWPPVKKTLNLRTAEVPQHAGSLGRLDAFYRDGDPQRFAERDDGFHDGAHGRVAPRAPFSLITVVSR